MNKKNFGDMVFEHPRHLLAGDFDQIVKHYQEVFPVFILGKANLIDGHDHLRLVLKNMRGRLLSEGVTNIIGNITDEQDVGNDRYRICVDWLFYSGADPRPKRNSVVYFCRHQKNQCKVEMVEYKRLAFREILGREGFKLHPIRNPSGASARILH